MNDSPQKLALLGGPKTRHTPFPPHPVIGKEEKQAVLDVLSRGKLSTFLAVPGEYFNGGAEIRRFEREFADYHGVRFAVAFNSATAALHAAVAAVGVQPGEEVIVPPYTFTSTATCALMHNAIPVFADIDDTYFCLDPAAVARSVSPLTRALIPVHLFGGTADMDGLLAVARKHNLKVIEDCAQAPGAEYRGRKVGAIGDCGVFSFTESKTITSGEGGMLITSDEQIAEVVRMVRNHGEIILDGQKERTYRSTILGWNYRMTEMDAALGRVQFGRLDTLNAVRRDLCGYLSRQLSGLPGLTPPAVRADCTHGFYLYAMKFDPATAGISRSQFLHAVQAEGLPIAAGYVRPLYLNPIYQENRAAAFAFYRGQARYEKGLCAVTERMHEQELLTLSVLRAPATRADVDDFVAAFKKVLGGAAEIRNAGTIETLQGSARHAPGPAPAKLFPSRDREGAVA
ncbi:L-glutamine:scyllo-inosose aminotransferase [Phycisphaerae bacterium RAS1]|nr:L-glutamine:scyllo-inosose aminotransferase [Phycisphaerae bacterium RAS1]